MADIEVKLPSHLVSDEVRRRVEAHKVYRTEVGAALNIALEVAIGFMDADDFDADVMKEMDSIASEWHDMEQQVLLARSTIKVHFYRSNLLQRVIFSAPAPFPARRPIFRAEQTGHRVGTKVRD